MLLHSTHTRNERRSPGGFTLIEALLVAVVTTILMYSMAMIFEKAALIVGMSESEIETRQKARSIFSRLDMDLRSAFVDAEGRYFQSGSGYMKFVTSTKNNPEGLIGRMDITQLVYKLERDSEAEMIQKRKGLPVTVSQPMLVRYSLAYLSEGAFAKFRSNYPDQPYPSRAYPEVDLGDDAYSFKQYVDIVAANVLDFKVECLDSKYVSGIAQFSLGSIDRYWRDRKEGKTPLPKAVRVRVCVSDDKGRVTRAFESVFNPKFTSGSI